MAKECNVFPECESCEQTMSCFRKIAGILSDEEIRHFEIIKNDKASSHNPTVYDLRLGEYHYLYDGNNSDNGTVKWKAVYLGNKSLARANDGWDDPADRFEYPNDADHTKLVIPPLGSALIELYETIDTDTVADSGILVTGRFDLKLSLVNKGLISQQGTQIEPCYKGKMYCFIHNLSGSEITLKRHQNIASIEFSYVSCFCKAEKRVEIVKALRKKNRDDNRYPFPETCNVDKGIINIRYFKQRRQLPDDCGLYSYASRLETQCAALDAQVKESIENHIVDESVINKIKQKLGIRLELLKVIISAAVTIIVAIITGYFSIVKPVTDQNNEYKGQISELQVQVEELQQVKKELEDFLASHSDLGIPGEDISSDTNIDSGN